VAKKPNVLLMVFDALRPDYLSCYGEDFSRVTPGFDSIATQGTLFENAFTVGRNTSISHGVMFTGQYPSETGLVGGFRSVPEDTETIAEYLKRHGYETFAISRKSGRLSSDFEHDRGFDEFFEPDKENAIPTPSTEYLRAALTNPIYLRELLRTLRYGPGKITNLKFDLLLDRVQHSEQPFFGFINQMTTHGPYRPPRPHMEQVVPSYDEPNLHVSEWIAGRLGIESRSLDHPRVTSSEIIDGTGFKDHNFDKEGWLNESELTIIRQMYGGLVDYLDRQLRSFLASLRDKDVLKNTILILTADHGEHLGEHGIIGHSHFLYDEVLRVPLIITGPSVDEGVRRTDLVSLIDLYETICDLCDLPRPEHTSGQSIFDPDERDAIFAEYGIRDAEKMGYGDMEGEPKKEIELGRKCVRTDSHKYVLDSSDGQHLYTIPGEQEVKHSDENLVDSFHADLIEALGSEFKEKLDHDESEMSEYSLHNLRELGYIE